MATSDSDPVLDKEEEGEGNAQNMNANDRKTNARTVESKQSPLDGRSSVLKFKDEDEEASRLPSYATRTEEADQGNNVSSREFLPTPGSDGNTRLRRASKLVSREFQRRRSSVEEALPKTPQGWTILLSALAAATTAYEINLQHSLTAPPIVFGQGIGTSSNNTDSSKSATNRQMSMIYDKLTATPSSIFSRKIQPSLFVGTRGMVASTAAYMFGGPSSEHEKLHWKFREILIMTQDGARLAVDWEVPRQSPDTQMQQQQQPQLLSFEQRKAEILQGPIQQPVVLIFHGINNDASFGYMQSLQRTFANRGWAAAALNFRGVGGIPLATPQGYNAAFTGDIRNVILQLSSRLEKDVPLFLVGNSLGANLMTKYLGEEGYAGTLPHCVAGAVSLGNPMQIHSAHVPFPLNIIMGLGVKKTFLENRHLFHDVNDPHWQATARKAMFASTVANFDKAIAPQLVRNEPFPPYAPRIGYETGEDYWHDSSSYRHIRNITVPFLNLTAEDDLLVSTPSRNKLGYSLANPNVMVAETRCGGHLGWQESPPDSKSILDFGASPWADTAASDFFQAILDTKAELKRRSGFTIHDNQTRQTATTIERSEVEGDSIELARSRIVDEARLSSTQLRSKL